MNDYVFYFIGQLGFAFDGITLHVRSLIRGAYSLTSWNDMRAQQSRRNRGYEQQHRRKLLATGPHDPRR